LRILSENSVENSRQLVLAGTKFRYHRTMISRIFRILDYNLVSFLAAHQEQRAYTYTYAHINKTCEGDNSFAHDLHSLSTICYDR